MRCSKCGSDNREGRKFCTNCGASLVAACPKCASAIQPDEKFCGECGAEIGVSAPSATPRAQPTPVQLTDAIAATELMDGERKTVTALFADIKGSMELMEDLDPEEARAIVDPALQLMIEAVHRYDGYVVQSTGDGIFALFGAPLAHEDHPQRALYAALRMQEEMRRYEDRLRRQGRAPIQIRIGINTGDVVVREVRTGAHPEYTPIGHTANLASRLQNLARSGSIVVSEATEKLVEGYFQLKSLGAAQIKGVSEPVNVYEVTGLGALRTRLQASVQRGLSRFVGREAELAQMRHALDLATAGHGQIVAVMGEPGVGKSRLFFEFRALAERGCNILEAYSVSYGRASPYLPVLELLRNYFRLTPEDDERQWREKITGKVLTLDRSLEDTLAYLFALLGLQEGDDPVAQMDAQVRRRRTQEAVKRILLRESLNQPIILLFEDLHWIDGETQALLDLLAHSIATARILLLVNYRPEYHHQWGSLTYYMQLRLDPLGRESAELMLAELLGASAELIPLRDFIIAKTEGNPFFVEEIVQALLEQRILVRNGAAHLARALGEIKLPPTVQGILAARIDRLPGDEKALLQTLAVIGAEFPIGLVRRVTAKADDELEPVLENLRRREFVYEQPAFPETEYAFKHALTQEVAYNSVLAERRKILHQRTGAAIEALYAERIEDHVNALAHHYGRSADVNKAIAFLQLAARQCALRSADHQAITYLDHALELLNALPDTDERDRQELALQIAKGDSLYVSAGFAADETGRVYGRARQLCARFGDKTQLFSVLLGLRLFHRYRLELETSRQLEEQLVEIAEELKSPAMLAVAHGTLGTSLLWMGELVGAREYLQRARNEARSIGGTSLELRDYNQLAAGWSFLAWSQAVLGFFDQAAKTARQAMAWAEHLARPFPLAVALLYVSELDQLSGNVDAAYDHSARAFSIATEYGFTPMASMAAVIQGWAHCWRGQVESGIAEMRRGIHAAEATGVRTPIFLLFPLIQAHVQNGHAEDAECMLAQTLETASITGHRLLEAELYRLKGDLLLRTCDETRAQSCFQKAIEIARDQSAKWWQLRATTSLARRLATQGRRDEACTMLAEIYDWFTEGFDTADLKEAKALLDELSR
jgi:class 3 adenylate cyclase/tetratricopeptide (TPR) repeat protein